MHQPERKSTTDNRRDFLRESLILAAVPAALAGNVAQAAFVTTKSAVSTSATQPIRLGVLGCGRRGLQLTRTALASSLAQVQISGLADIFPDRVQQLYRSINGNFSEQVLLGSSGRYTGLRAAEQLAASDVQAVIVSAAPGFRVNHLRLLADAGKHLYVERPIATTREETLQVAELARQVCQHGQVIQFGMQHRYQPFFTTLVEQLQQGAIGRLLLARISLERPAEQVPARSKRVSDYDYRLRYWQQDSALGGHPLVEQLSGQLDMVNWIAGSTPVVAVRSSASDQDQALAVEMTYSNGLKLDCQLNTVAQGQASGLSVLVQGTEGWCDVLKGKIFNQSNRLKWSASGASADIQPVMDAWLSNLHTGLGSSNCESLDGVSAAVEANLAALLAQAALEQAQLTSQPEA